MAGSRSLWQTNPPPPPLGMLVGEQHVVGKAKRKYNNFNLTHRSHLTSSRRNLGLKLKLLWQGAAHAGRGVGPAPGHAGRAGGGVPGLPQAGDRERGPGRAQLPGGAAAAPPPAARSPGGWPGMHTSSAWRKSSLHRITSSVRGCSKAPLLQEALGVGQVGQVSQKRSGFKMAQVKEAAVRLQAHHVPNAAECLWHCPGHALTRSCSCLHQVFSPVQ